VKFNYLFREHYNAISTILQMRRRNVWMSGLVSKSKLDSFNSLTALLNCSNERRYSVVHYSFCSGPGFNIKSKSPVACFTASVFCSPCLRHHSVIFSLNFKSECPTLWKIIRHQNLLSPNDDARLIDRLTLCLSKKISSRLSSTANDRFSINT
jgi:hypothetical protein